MRRQQYAGAGGDVRSSESREQAPLNTRSATPENAPPLNWRDEPRQTYQTLEPDGNAGAGGGVSSFESSEQTQQKTRSGSMKQSIACICRDSEGRMMDGVAKAIRASSPLMAETLALLEAINFFYPKRREALLFVSDSSQLVKAMTSSQQFSWEVQPIISKCKENLQAFSNVR